MSKADSSLIPDSVKILFAEKSKEMTNIYSEMSKNSQKDFLSDISNIRKEIKANKEYMERAKNYELYKNPFKVSFLTTER